MATTNLAWKDDLFNAREALGEKIARWTQKENAVEELRELIGDADPEKRRPGTIRDLYAEGVTENAVHASDSEASAERETRLIFG